MSTEEEEEDLDQLSMEVDFLIYTPDADRISLRQIAYGVSPIVTLEPKFDGEKVSLEIISSKLDFGELAELFEFAAEYAKKAEAKGAEGGKKE